MSANPLFLIAAIFNWVMGGLLFWLPSNKQPEFFQLTCINWLLQIPLMVDSPFVENGKFLYYKVLWHQTV